MNAVQTWIKEEEKKAFSMQKTPSKPASSPPLLLDESESVNLTKDKDVAVDDNEDRDPLVCERAMSSPEARSPGKKECSDSKRIDCSPKEHKEGEIPVADEAKPRIEVPAFTPAILGIECRDQCEKTPDSSSSSPKKIGQWTVDEDKILVDLQAKWGNRWTKISKLLPGRSENAVKNRWKSASIQRSLQARSNGSPVGGSDTPSAPWRIEVKSIQGQVDSNYARPDKEDKGAEFHEKKTSQGVSAAHEDSIKSTECRELPKRSPVPDANSNLSKKRKGPEDRPKKKAKKRPSRSKAAMAAREREKALATESDQKVKELFDEEPLSDRDKSLIRKAFLLGMKQGQRKQKKKHDSCNTSYFGCFSANMVRPDTIQWRFHDPRDGPIAGDLPVDYFTEHGVGLDVKAMKAACSLY